MLRGRCAPNLRPAQQKSYSLGSALTTEPDDVYEEGEVLVLATEAREARVAMHQAASVHSTRIFQEAWGVVIAALGFFIGDPHYEVVAVGLAMTLGVEFFRRRAKRKLDHARERVETLEEVHRTVAERERHHTS